MNENEEDLKTAYEKQNPLLSAWGKTVLRNTLRGLAIKLGAKRRIKDFLKIWPSVRIKKTDSFLAKALRRGKNYPDPLNEITDRVGVRFVVLLNSELKTIQSVIEEAAFWEAEKARDFHEERLERPHHFDYQSDHYIVRPRKPGEHYGIIVPADMPCEVQVRTLLQHAYAELAHDSLYKPTVSVEPEVSRQLAKCAALVETTDEIFMMVNQAVENASAEIRRVEELALAAYKSLVNREGIKDRRLAGVALDAYRTQLGEITEESLDDFLKENDFIGDKINERASRQVLYRNPVVLAFYFLISKYPDLVPKRWPFDLSHLAPIYSDLGISTIDRL